MTAVLSVDDWEDIIVPHSHTSIYSQPYTNGPGYVMQPCHKGHWKWYVIGASRLQMYSGVVPPEKETQRCNDRHELEHPGHSQSSISKAVQSSPCRSSPDGDHDEWVVITAHQQFHCATIAVSTHANQQTVATEGAAPTVLFFPKNDHVSSPNMSSSSNGSFPKEQ